MHAIWANLGWVIIGIIVLAIALLAVLARQETRMVWPYGDLEPVAQFMDPSGYGQRRADEAVKAGFTLLGWSPHLEAPQYQVSYAFLISPEYDCLALIGSGTILSKPWRGAWLYSRTIEGRFYCTTDKQAGVEIDVSRHWQSCLANRNSFQGLWQSHRDMLAEWEITPRAFVAGRELEEFRASRELHCQELLRAGLIAFTDPAATHWRYTWWGALKIAVLNPTIRGLRMVSNGKFPKVA